MEIILDPEVIDEILQYYQNVMKRHPNSYSLEDILNRVDLIEEEAYKVGSTGLSRVYPKTSHLVNRWKDYTVEYSKTGWYFAYIIEGDIIHVYEAVKEENMSNKAFVKYPNKNMQSNKK